MSTKKKTRRNGSEQNIKRGTSPTIRMKPSKGTPPLKEAVKVLLPIVLEEHHEDIYD
ncbi:hypothetical protein [Thiohalobacter thiocyanaticus]|uniref:hypothetical protein n=1 Tax=Thiohalobacter thiocyanaticus TaxID=585455 RepID=UPI0012FD4B71|nr:hypothetical protein [Thiohalobacter thiocyanaticus]